MTVALAMAAFIIGWIFVWLGEPFGRLSPGAPTILGFAVFAAALPLLLFREPIRVRVEATHPRRFQVCSLLAIVLVTFWLLLVVRRFGPSPTLYVLQRQVPPASILQGVYREQLPLRAFWPPVMLALAVVSFMVATNKRQFLWAAVALLALIGFIAVYETRHLVIWLAIYVLLFRAMHVRQFASLLNTRMLLVGGLGFAAFVLIGNIRSGVGTLDSEVFASAMGVSPQFSHASISLVWLLIYLFSGFARGIANDSYVPVLRFAVPEKLFPGFVQRLDLFTNHFPTSPAYSEQGFAVDAWHSYCLAFGIVGALLLVVLIVVSLHATIRTAHRRLQLTGQLPAGLFAVMLWLMVRVALLPIGDYVLDFGAFVELAALCAFLWIAGARIVSR